jgi:hypothetical protein
MSGICLDSLRKSLKNLTQSAHRHTHSLSHACANERWLSSLLRKKNVLMRHFFRRDTVVILAIITALKQTTYQNTAKYRPLHKGYLVSILCWVVNKSSDGKKIVSYTKNMYIFQLLLNIVITRTETVVSGNNFLCACVKEACCLWAQPCFETFHHHRCWSAVIPTSSSSRETGGSCLEQDQGCKEGGLTTASWNVPVVLKWEQLYADKHCHEIHCHLCGTALNKVKAEAILCILCNSQAFSEPMLCKTCDNLA